MRRIPGRRALTLAAVPLILAPLGVALFRSVRFASNEMGCGAAT